MSKEKKVIDEALLDLKEIQAVLKANTKEILRATMNEEITQVMKESLNEADYDEEDIEGDNKEESGEESTETGEESTEGDESPEIEKPVELGDEKPETEEPIDATGEEIGGDDFEELDLTGASDEEVISVFKKLKDEDEIEVISNKEVKITDPESGNEYTVKLGGGKPSESQEADVVDDFGTDEFGTDEFETNEGDEMVYEIALTEESEMGVPRKEGHDKRDEVKKSTMPKGDIEGQKAEKSDVITDDNLTGGFEEDAPGKACNHAEHVMETEELLPEEEQKIEEKIVVGLAQDGKAYSDLTDIKGAGGKVRQTNEAIIKKYNTLVNEVNTLRREREDFKAKLAQFRDLLAETVVYNSNLTYVTKLFTEHSTTREEKESIMKRFDSEVKSLRESKSLYKTLVSELKSKKPITESINGKLDKSQSSGISKINESIVYVDESTSRIKDLIKRVENR